MRARLLIAGLALLAVMACSPGEDEGLGDPQASPTASPMGTPQAGLAQVEVRFADAVVTAEVAATADQRRTGLMWRTELGPDEGMLFVFPEQQSGGFWMKNTLIPLQIAYMTRMGGGELEIVAILDMVPCEADPCTTYPPGTPDDTALEVNAGWFDRTGIDVGDRATVAADLG
jgi:uncharacterized membrane protein (UPF0127 family)